MGNTSFIKLKPNYTSLWETMVINTQRLSVVNTQAARILKSIEQYKAVEEITGVPWVFIGIIHSLECDCQFNKHLHNGDPLTARTVQVPAGRPLKGNPPFSWKDSAVDAITMKKLSGANDWSIEGILYQLEAYNGWGYRLYHNTNTPYLWSGSNHYTKGKYASDGNYDTELVSKQIGAALLLKVLLTK
jgi:lysozyme family protein